MSGLLAPLEVRRAAARVFKDPAAFKKLTPASLRGNVQVAMAAVSSPAKTVRNFLQSASWCQGQDFILPSLVCGFLAEDAVHQRSWALRFASEKLRGDREFMLAAVKQSGYALQHASDELRGDAEVVLAAVRQDGYALVCASQQLKGDREVVLAAVRQEGEALMFASEELQGDREIVLLARG